MRYILDKQTNVYEDEIIKLVSKSSSVSYNWNDVLTRTVSAGGKFASARREVAAVNRNRRVAVGSFCGERPCSKKAVTVDDRSTAEVRPSLSTAVESGNSGQRIEAPLCGHIRPAAASSRTWENCSSRSFQV